MDDFTRFRLRNVLSCIIESVVKRGDEVVFHCAIPFEDD